MKKTAILKRCVKIMMVLIMLLGILFSIFNFLPVETKAVAVSDGHWEDFQNGASVCMPPGSDCSVQMRRPSD